MPYPPNIAKRLVSLEDHVASTDEVAAVGADANFACGSIVRFYLNVDVASLTLENVRFRSNGCGYMLAAAFEIARSLSGQELTTLRGLDHLSGELERDLGPFPDDRKSCIDASVAAIQMALADLRRLRVAEFVGETALICTCFGVDEPRIESVIADGATSVEDVTAACTAAGGCGSCRMLIQEMLDGAIAAKRV